MTLLFEDIYWDKNKMVWDNLLFNKYTKCDGYLINCEIVKECKDCDFIITKERLKQLRNEIKIKKINKQKKGGENK